MKVRMTGDSLTCVKVTTNNMDEFAKINKKKVKYK